VKHKQNKSKTNNLQKKQTGVDAIIPVNIK